MKQSQLLIGLPTLIALSSSILAQDINPYDQSKVPLEKDTTDRSVTKIVLVAGQPSHGPEEHEHFAGCALLMNLLKQTPGVFPVMVRDGWPKNPEIFENAKALVFYMDGGTGHPIIQDGHMDLIEKYIGRGVGFVNLHYAVEYPKEPGKRILNWLGGYYEQGYSINPNWKADFKSLPKHPITRGVKPFQLEDEWYYNMRFAPDRKGVTPILKAIPPDATRGTPAAKEYPGREEITAWAFQRRDGGRSFGFTGGHWNKNWGDENFRRIVVNAILWTAKVKIPPTGAPVQLDPADLNKNLDDKRPKPHPASTAN